METAVQIAIVVVCIAATCALGSVAYLAFSVGKTVDDTIKHKIGPLLTQAANVLSSAQHRVDTLPEVVGHADDVLVSANKVAGDVKVVTGHVANATDKVAEVAKKPAKIAKKAAVAVHDFTEEK